MIVIHFITGDNSRVYFGTDTRLQTLLLGCILAFIWPPFALKKDISKKIVVSLDIIGISGFCGSNDFVLYSWRPRSMDL